MSIISETWRRLVVGLQKTPCTHFSKPWNRGGRSWSSPAAAPLVFRCVRLKTAGLQGSVLVIKAGWGNQKGGPREPVCPCLREIVWSHADFRKRQRFLCSGLLEKHGCKTWKALERSLVVSVCETSESSGFYWQILNCTALWMFGHQTWSNDVWWRPGLLLQSSRTY